MAVRAPNKANGKPKRDRIIQYSVSDGELTTYPKD